MTGNAILKSLPIKKAALTDVEDERAGSLLFRRPRIWEVDETNNGDSWCD